ncbi:hypothetical protein [Dethiobacter alkaliphilus]|uniref:DUF429 domain-containing protein n=1 Tax=Dethiobacter alkaliphilus AHT 1 TaxID=555088 RepID=C0GD12_DETAL|nr:hypothetical protein [Dethiobacter alkaliphilus]EEG79097.1 conserved hypothetical protein [Dethiobacter alkaliphilus AHT 1]
MQFNKYIGIDYSGARSPQCRLSGLQVYLSKHSQLPQIVKTPSEPANQHWNWSRKEVAHWLIEQIKEDLVIIGIDHSFSFPDSYFKRYGLQTWDEFLTDFCQHWPTHEPYYVDDLRDNNPRTGNNTDLRLTESWTSSAKSVFHFDVQGQVAKSSHAGIPWLYHIRQQIGNRVHFWPYDGFEIPPLKSVIAEVYPSILKNRYLKEDRNPDQHDAYSISRWLNEADNKGILNNYFNPPLTDEEIEIVSREGWILGIY